MALSPELVGGGVGRAALGDDLELDPALVAAVDVHLGRLADHDVVLLGWLPRSLFAARSGGRHPRHRGLVGGSSARRSISITRSGTSRICVGLEVWSHGRPIPLSERVPVLENMGFRVVDERTYQVDPAGGEPESGSTT